MREIGLLSVDSTASNWRDISSRQQIEERCTRIFFATVAVLAACCTVLSGYVFILIAPYFTVAPALVMGWFTRMLVMSLVTAILAETAFTENREVLMRGASDDFSKNEILDSHIRRLGHQNLKTLYSYYRNGRSGGLGPLVRHGILSVQQGNDLQKLFSHYETLSSIYPDHNGRNEEMEANACFLSRRLEAMQKDIQNRFNLKPKVALELKDLNVGIAG